MHVAPLVLRTLLFKESMVVCSMRSPYTQFLDPIPIARCILPGAHGPLVVVPITLAYEHLANGVQYNPPSHPLPTFTSVC